MKIDWLGTVFQIVLNVLLFGLIFYFFPKKKSTFLSDKTAEQLSKEFKRLYYTSSFLILPLIALLALAPAYIFQAISAIKFNNISNALVIVKPDIWAWVLACSLLSFGLTYQISIRLTKVYLKDRFNDYIVYQNLMFGADAYGLMQWISPLLIGISLFFNILISGSSTILYPDKIVVNYYFSFSTKEYKYTDVKKIEELSTEKGESYFHITFSDGKVWKSRQNGFGNADKDYDIIDIIEEKTDLEMWDE